MQIPYSVRPCKYGKGLFASQNIMKGTLVWKLLPQCMKLFPTQESFKNYLNTLESHYEKQMFLQYSMTFDDNQIVYIWDDGKYTNHSEEPNIQRTKINDKSINTIDTHAAYAIKDIKEGEEITQNYTLDKLEAGPQWWIDLSVEYGVWLVHHNDELEKEYQAFDTINSITNSNSINNHLKINGINGINTNKTNNNNNVNVAERIAEQVASKVGLVSG